MRHSVMLGMLLAATSQGVVLNNNQQMTLDKLVGSLPTSDGKTRRGKGRQAKPAKKGNAKTTSYRTKAKHRKAA